MDARWMPIGTAVAVLAVVGAVTLVIQSTGSSEPPLLRLAADGTAERGAPAADSARSAGKIGAAGTSFRLSGNLPDGPAEARVQTLPEGPSAEKDVLVVAKALGLAGAPVRDGRGWRLAGLYVGADAGRPWSLSSCGPDSPVSSESSVSSDGISSESKTACLASSAGGSSDSGGSGGSASGTVDPAADPAMSDPVLPPCPDNARCGRTVSSAAARPVPPAPDPADPQQLRAAAAPILAALGLSGAAISVEVYGGSGSVIADPVVNGLPTVGYETRLELDDSGKVLGANGYLADPAPGASYPLLSAREAFDAIPEQLRALQRQCDGCPEPTPATITGARLGLQLTGLRDDEAALLPAWLFTVKGWPQPLAQNAIPQRYLAPPEEPGDPTVAPVDPATPPDAPTTSAPEPAPPKPAPPTAATPAPSRGERAPVSFDSAYPSDDPRTVIVQYGDSSSCPHENVTHAVKESDDSVVVILEADAQPGDGICTADYRQMLVTVKLRAPLGSRTVVDGSRGEPVAVDRSCRRPMGGPPPPSGTACAD